jgi:carbamoyltransferase
VAFILGISAYYHDSAAVLISGGSIVAAAQEERFTRKKHDPKFPSQAITYCLKEAGITAEEIDYVVFYDKPLLKFDRLLETYLAYAPLGLRSFFKAMPLWLHQKLHLPREIRRELGGAYKKRIIFTEHHEAHAASAFFPSPYNEAAIVTIDGVGEWATTSIGIGKQNKVTLTHEIHFPHSLGLLYSAFTYQCGFKVNSGEYKLMGLAPYGEPKYEKLIREHLIDLREDGSFRLNMDFFNYCQGLTMTNSGFDKLFGGPPRSPEEELTQREMDLAASVQRVTEDAMLRICAAAQKETGMKNLCLAGGVALNCVGNGRVLRESGFENIWIQPASGDAGGALGAALLVSHQLLEQPRVLGESDGQQASLLGPSYSNDEVRACLAEANAEYQENDNEEQLLQEVVTHIEAGRVVGWFHGRMEFGPRALGSRSIIGDPRDKDMRSRMNLKIKFRESFRPFAAMVLDEHLSEYFEMNEDEESPYMLIVRDIRSEKRLPYESATQAGLERLKQPRSLIPAVTHVDDSARIQTVDKERNPRLHRLMELFKQATGCPVLINTSFNVRGEPIVCSPEDAYRCFMNTDMDVLVLNDFLLLKEQQPQAPEASRDTYLNRFDLD